jgi:hypothetical protein
LVTPSRRREEEETESKHDDANGIQISQGLIETRKELQDARAQLGSSQEQLKLLTEAVIDITRTLEASGTALK